MEVIFCRNLKPFSLLIRLLTWSKWSHCGIIIDDKVLHATALNGVTCDPIEKIKSQYTFEIYKMNGSKEKAKSLLGSKYNWLGLIGMWDYKGKSKRFYCNEYVAHCLYNLDAEPNTRQKKWIKNGLTPFVFRLFI